MEISGIVLAGGMSRRFGRNKAIEAIGGEPLITRVIRRLSQVSPQIVVVVNDHLRASELSLPESARVVEDVYPGAGPLGGIFTGLSAVEGPWAFVAACDLPFLSVPLLRHMPSIRDGFDAVVPVSSGGRETTHALYSKTCLPYIERRLQASDLKIDRFFKEVRIRFLAEEDVERLDPGQLSFFNINTRRDFDRAQTLLAKGL